MAGSWKRIHLCVEPEYVRELKENLRVCCLRETMLENRWVREKFHTHHIDCLDGFLLPVWQGRHKFDIIVLEHTDAEGHQCIVSSEYPATWQSNCNSWIWVLDVLHCWIKKLLGWLQERLCLCLHDGLETPLINAKKIILGKASHLWFESEIVVLSRPLPFTDYSRKKNKTRSAPAKMQSMTTLPVFVHIPNQKDNIRTFVPCVWVASNQQGNIQRERSSQVDLFYFLRL